MVVNGTKMSMTRGDSESIVVAINDVPFTEGHVIEMTVRKKFTSDIAFHKEITEFEEDGTALIPIDPEDTKDLDFGLYVYDVQWTDDYGNVKTIIKPTANNFEITEEVTY